MTRALEAELCELRCALDERAQQHALNERKIVELKKALIGKVGGGDGDGDGGGGSANDDVVVRRLRVEVEELQDHVSVVVLCLMTLTDKQTKVGGNTSDASQITATDESARVRV
jgi:hypothetical protein